MPPTTAGESRPLILLDGPAYRDEMAKTLEVERDLLRRLNLLPGGEERERRHSTDRRSAHSGACDVMSVVESCDVSGASRIPHCVRDDSFS